MIRTFIAVELDSTLKQAIGGVQESMKHELHGLAPGVRLQWVRIDSIHLTLKFLGDIDEEQVPNVLDSLETVAREHEPFSVEVKGFGGFPTLRAPRVLWLGFADSTDRLTRLAGSIDAVLTPLGFHAEGKPYSPHLTLARVKEESRALSHALADSGLTRDVTSRGILPVRAVALMKSERTSSGSVYVRLGEATLGHSKV